MDVDVNCQLSKPYCNSAPCLLIKGMNVQLYKFWSTLRVPLEYNLIQNEYQALQSRILILSVLQVSCRYSTQLVTQLFSS